MYVYREDVDITFYDVVVALFIFTILMGYAWFVKIRKQDRFPEYRYYVPGLMAKLLGGISFALVYALYYGGGDTVLYYYSSCSMINLAFFDLQKFVSLMLGNLTPENFSVFGPQIGYVSYRSDYNSFSAIRFSVPFVFIAGKSFLGSTLLIAAFTYNGLWAMFRLLYYRFKELPKAMAFSVLFVPSTIFWGSGIMKDSYTLMAAMYFFVAYYNMIEYKNFGLKYIFLIFFASFILLSIKPYIFISLIIGVIITLLYKYYKVKNVILKTTIIPIILVVGILFLISMTISISGRFNEQYSSIDRILQTAYISQKDLKQAYYGGNSFDIGDFEPTIPGILSKFHLATLAGLYRPYLWDVRNPVMLISALENSIFLFLSLYVLLLSVMTWRRHGWSYMRKILLSDSFIVFGLTFSIIFAYFMGLTTSNFGSLVRYKIPLLPFFMASLFIIVNRFNIEADKTKKLNKKLI